MDNKEYLRESARTAAGTYHEHLVTAPELDFMLQAVIQASQWADRVKRALFYGKSIETTRVFSTTSLQHRPEISDIMHAMLGCVTEAGELAEHVRDVLGGAKPLDRTNLVEEFGDQLWYIALGLRALPSDFEEAFAVNIAKLRKRFPDKFTTEAALNRDLGGERAVLEGKPSVGSLEDLLNSEDGTPVQILPDGSVRPIIEQVGLVQGAILYDIAPGSIWKHRNGNLYQVEFLTNLPNEERYPLTVVYRGENGIAWSRRADDWHRSMTLVTYASQDTEAAFPREPEAVKATAADDYGEAFHYVVGVLDRILIESTSLPEARRWAFDALLDVNQVDLAQPAAEATTAEPVTTEWDPQP